jgi:predicted small metal-binding protein
MRVLDCDCGQTVQGATDDELVNEVRRHVDDSHPDMELSDDQLREMVSQKAYDATDS